MVAHVQCGQAMVGARVRSAGKANFQQESYCPECGSVIGGANHALRDDNTRDDDMERIARAQGGTANPFAGDMI